MINEKLNNTTNPKIRAKPALHSNWFALPSVWSYIFTNQGENHAVSPTVQSEKLSGAVVRQVEELILRGVLRPGERLPPERELAERLGVSRPSLRDAIGSFKTPDC